MFPLDIDAQQLRKRLSDHGATVGQGVARRVTIDGLDDVRLFLTEHRADGYLTDVTRRRLTRPLFQFRQLFFDIHSNLPVSFLLFRRCRPHNALADFVLHSSPFVVVLVYLTRIIHGPIVTRSVSEGG